MTLRFVFLTDQFVEPAIDGDVADKMEDIVVLGGRLRVELKNWLPWEWIVNRPVETKIVTLYETFNLMPIHWSAYESGWTENHYI